MCSSDLNYFTLGSLVDNYVFVRYEDVREDPEGFIDYLSKNYNLSRKETFTPIVNHRGGNRKYQQVKYFHIPKEVLNFINTHIDWETEALAGYESSDDPESNKKRRKTH